MNGPMPEVVQPEGWPAPRGYAHGMVAAGRLLAVAGQLGAGRDGALVGPELARQFDQALANVIEVVRAAGGAPTDIVSITAYVTDHAQYLGARAALGEVWRARMGRHYPAMTLVEVRALLETGAVVELQALAVLPQAR
jgi:enamine deaminase RidA (YjgF/YER057c/UK114 family)